MKKVLLGTSALALASAFATSATAAEWEVKVGGYLEEHVAFATSDNNFSGDYDGLHTISDGEIHFKPSITLDNGLTFGARIELEGAPNRDRTSPTGSEPDIRGSSDIDENFIFISGSFGRLVIGDDDNAANTMHYTAPDVSMVNINSGSDTLFLPFASEFGMTTTTVPYVESDSAGLHYYTPRVAGFQAGVSYARDSSQSVDDAIRDCDSSSYGNADNACHVWGVGANYVNSFGDVSVALSGGYTTMNVVGDDDPRVWATGLNIGFGGITVGASYADFKRTNVSDENGYVYDVGASYETGPWGFSVTWVHAVDQVDGEANPTMDKFLVAGTYTLAQGVRVGAFAIYAEGDGGDNCSGSEVCFTNSATDGDGFVIGTSIRLDF